MYVIYMLHVCDDGTCVIYAYLNIYIYIINDDDDDDDDDGGDCAWIINACVL